MMSCQRICESQESLADCPHLYQVFCEIMKAKKKTPIKTKQKNVFFDGISTFLKPENLSKTL